MMGKEFSNKWLGQVVASCSISLLCAAGGIAVGEAGRR